VSGLTSATPFELRPPPSKFVLVKLAALLLILVPTVLSASVTLEKSGDGGITFRYVPGKVALTACLSGGSAISLDDADHLAEPGEPDLPGKLVRIGIPQTGGVRISISTGPEHSVQGVSLANVPHMSWDRDSAWFDKLPADSRLSSPKPVEAGPAEILRRVRFVPLRLSPCSYNKDANALTYYEWLDVSVTFEQRPQTHSDPDPLDGAVSAMLLNGKEALDWKLDWPAETASQFERSPFWLRIQVDTTGIYSISGRELAAAGVSLPGLNPATLALYTIGEHEPNDSYPDTMRQVPIIVQGGEGGRLAPADRLIFYGLAPSHWVGRCSVYVKNYFTRHNVYWLTWGGAQGSRIVPAVRPDTIGAPVVDNGGERLHQERDLDCPARSGLLWIWAQLFKASDRAATVLDVPLDITYPVQVQRLSGRFLADDDGNQLSVSFNHRAIAAYQFGQSPPSSPFDFSADTVLPANFASNVLTFELGGDGEKSLYLDYLEIGYRRRLSLYPGQFQFLSEDTGRFWFCIKDARERPVVLDVTDPYTPTMSDSVELLGDSARFCWRVTRPAEFAVAGASQFLKPAGIELRHPGQLRSQELRADYWIVTPKEFVVTAQRMAGYRTGRIAGIPHAVARAATLDDIDDDYAFGMEEPGAIKRFFADKHPAYGLLAGDATCDYKGILSKRPPGVPAYEYGFGLNPDAYDRSALAFDAWYADFEGDGSSPDMALGRVTCRSAAQLGQFVDKLIAYDAEPAGLWNRRYLLLADDEFLGWDDPNNPRWWDPITFGHIGNCEAMGALTGNALDLVKVYLTEWPYVEIKNKPGAHAEFMRQMDLGGIVLAFFGHGAGYDLTHESVLNISQVPQIQNGHRNPFCFFGSCSVGRFDDTQYECIAEELVRQPSGAIAAAGATKATTAGSNLVFARDLMTPLFAQPGSTIGLCFLQAWPTDDIYCLFGDPATVLRLPQVSPQQISVAPDTLKPGAGFKVAGSVQATKTKFSWQLQGPRRIRTYRSFRGTTSYRLSGLELARGTGDITAGALACRGTFPLGVPLDTVFVPNGNYAPIPQSCCFSGSACGDSGVIDILHDSIAYTRTAAALHDTAGPAVSFFLNGNRLENAAVVPSKFVLDGVVSDSHGIMIAPVGGATPLFYVDAPTSAVDLTDLFVFDAGSTTTARFRLPVELAGPADSLFVTVSDNLLNRTVAGITVKPSQSDMLKIDSVLPYPDPVKAGCRFTFTLSRQADVRVRVYSMAGRLVRDLGLRPAGYGYNEIEWDGLDGDGNLPANGVYLFVVTAQADEAPGGLQRVTVRDKLLIHR